VDPCGTVTEVGRLADAGDALRETTAPPLGAADVRETVQVEPTDGVSVVGLHEMPLNRAVWRMVTVPPLTDVAIPVPLESADVALLSWTGDELSEVEFARVNVTEATTLSGIAVVFRPHTRQVAVPVPLVQLSDLFAAPVPAATVADVKSVVE
jgi:hypothetical protein